MDTIFTNSENSKTFDPHRPLLNLPDKMDLRRSNIYVALSNLSIYYTWKNISHTKTIKRKYQLQHGMMNLNNLMDDILYQIFSIILSISSKKNMK